MQLSDLVRALRRSWALGLACLLVTVSLTAGAAVLTKPSYTSSTQLFVAIQNSGSTQELQQGNTFSQARMRSYVNIVKTPLVLQTAVDSLALDVTAAELSKQVEVRADNNTVLITISVSDESPTIAAALAEAIGVSLIAAIEDLERSSAEAPSPVRLSVVTPAGVPTGPSSPNMTVYMLLGTALGCLVGLTAIILRSRLDTKVRGETDLSQLKGAPIVLGGIAFDTDATKNPLLTQTAQQSPRAESFRQIRTNLQFANISSKSKTMLVTSSLPGEGKSTTATNMAIALAQAGQRVALVDADLRRPMVSSYLGLEGGAGLTTALLGTADIADLLQPWGEDNLYVLTSGLIPPNPSELLGSNMMSAILDRLEDLFDVVIIDAPPLIPVTDASVLAQRAGGVVLIVGSGKVRKQDVEKSLTSLNLVDANMLGVVMNLVPAKGPDAYTYSYYSYESKPESQEMKTAKTVNGSHGNSPRRARSHSAAFDHISN